MMNNSTKIFFLFFILFCEKINTSEEFTELKKLILSQEARIKNLEDKMNGMHKIIEEQAKVIIEQGEDLDSLALVSMKYCELFAKLLPEELNSIKRNNS